jgi:hypothetical protein
MNAVLRTKRFWVRVALVAFGTSALAAEASAQIGWTQAGPDVCTSETTVSGVVTEKKTCVRWKPITQVCMKRQDCVTYRDECRVGYRPEQYVECVPKTCYEPVTVDEGCWKMVWCPKPVTKMVPKQTVEKRIACRNVPFTYTQKVPQVTSRMVPEYVTKYVPETYQTCERRPFCQKMPSQTTAMMPAAPSCASPAPSCAAPLPTTTYMAPAEPSCATPSMPTLAPSPTFSPEVPPGDPNASYSPAVPSGIVPEPTADPSSFYPTQPGASATAAAPRSETWTTIKPRNAETKDGSSSIGGGATNLASLWNK